ncbi:hypothetical protein BDN71DRAFT_1457587 [Pleurotus eryngii]|uniref:Uncharacterized protein n=1 Tax=Pleurotus eryngii TaxID=5323 RepID=A0A9P6D109_PLEER|nr:hypothetical protein BDN71DRAFT_1457587 [Pleurotus eryngii]
MSRPGIAVESVHSLLSAPPWQLGDFNVNMKAEHSPARIFCPDQPSHKWKGYTNALNDVNLKPAIN